MEKTIKFIVDERPDLLFIHEFTCFIDYKGKKYKITGFDGENPYGCKIFKDIEEFKIEAYRLASNMP